MTRKEAKRASEIMLAYANGEKIECYRPEINKWLEVSNDCLFNWDTTNYRIKPKEKFDPKTLKPFDKVLVRNTHFQTWCCNLFSNIDNRGEYPYICMSSAYNMVIPYDKNTEHLVGTADDVPDYYRYWED